MGSAWSVMACTVSHPASGRKAGPCYKLAMTADPTLPDFYASAQGAVAARLIRARLSAMWPSMGGMAVLGFGYAVPYLRTWRDSAARCVAAVPPQACDESGPSPWPPGQPNLCCAADEEALPFPDLSMDRVLVVHGLEVAGDARRLLREVWRVLKDDGRLLVVAPNRVGLWAHVESTPFGHGQPYSPGQVGRLLRASMFRVERQDMALYLPPVRLRMVLRSAAAWEAAGRRVVPRLSGVILTEATKDAFAALPVQATRRRTLVPVLAR